jgi:hypothetical protein
MSEHVTLPPMDPDAVCKCGHPVRHHDAGVCWTDAQGNETWTNDECRCSWLEVPS